MVLQSCTKKQENQSFENFVISDTISNDIFEEVVAEIDNATLSDYKSEIRPNEEIVLGKIYTDTVEYKSFNDQGDNNLVFVKKFNKEVSLIGNWAENLEFVNGDKVEITWKTDSIRYAGDEEYLNFADFLISIKKLK